MQDHHGATTALTLFFFGHSWLSDSPAGPIESHRMRIESDVPVFFFLNKEYARLREKIEFIASYNPTAVFSHHHDISSLLGKEVTLPVHFVPFGVDPEKFGSRPKLHDIFFSGILRNPTYPDSQSDERIRIQSCLFRTIFGIRVKALTNWDIIWNSFTNSILVDWLNNYKRLDDTEYSELLGATRIVFNALSPGSLIGPRFFETMISKSVILTSRSANFAYFLREGKNCVFYDDPEDFIKQVGFLLEESDLLDRISINARKDALKNHCWSHRVEEVLELMLL